MLTFQIENFSAFRDEARPLFERHWREIAIDQEQIPFAPDWQQYSNLEQLGMLHCLTVRCAPCTPPREARVGGAESRSFPSASASGQAKNEPSQDDNKCAIVGYFIALLVTHPHYSRSGRMAITDVYYLAPEHRTGGAGALMLMAFERSLRGIASKAYMSCKIHGGNDRQGLFERLGWRWTDKAFTRLIGE
jgi:hypothetical protein